MEGGAVLQIADRALTVSHRDDEGMTVTWTYSGTGKATRSLSTISDTWNLVGSREEASSATTRPAPP
jgi:hypothetical protein